MADRQLARLSLTDVFVLMLFSALAVGGIAGGNWVAWFGSTICVLAIVAQLIALIVGRGRIRAKSIGFMTPVALYCVTLALIGGSEFADYNGVLPHTRFVQERIHIEVSERVTTPNADHYFIQDMIKRSAQAKLPLAHLLVAVVAGYIGSRYAEYIYHHNPKPQDSGKQRSG